MRKPPEAKVQDALLLALSCKRKIGHKAALPTYLAPIQAWKWALNYSGCRDIAELSENLGQK